MNTLILEDDFVSRVLLQRLLLPYGECHVAARGDEAVEAFEMALNAGQPYDLVCLDIVMPGFDGRQALQAMRFAESKLGILSGSGSKIIMTTALGDMKHVMAAYSNFCNGYLLKPISRDNLAKVLRELDLTVEEIRS